MTDSSSTPASPQQACFEAGIKFGTLYHQFAGTPVSPASAPSLARAMEAAIENQPHCVDVTVTIVEERLAAAIADAAAEYVELTGRYMTVEIVIERHDYRVRTSMTLEDGYPLMQVDAVEPIPSGA